MIPLLLACQQTPGPANETTLPSDDTGANDTAPPSDDTDTDDTSDTVPSCEGTGVTFFSAEGAEVDLTDAFSTGEATTITEDGTLVVCPGTWFTQLWIEGADVTVMGSGREDTVLSGGEQYSVLTVVGPGEVSVSAVTIERGKAEGPGNYATGGGMRCWRASCTVSAASFVNNYAYDASAISVLTDESTGELTTLDVSDTTFSDNTAIDDGTVTVSKNCTVTMDGVVFENNTALDGSAISVLGEASLAITNSEFTQNSAITHGGALFVLGGQVSIDSSIFSGNTAERGGAILMSEAGMNAEAMLISDTLFDANVAADSGGAIYRYSNSPVIGSTVEFRSNQDSDLSTEGSTTTFEATVDFICDEEGCREGT